MRALAADSRRVAAWWKDEGIEVGEMSDRQAGKVSANPFRLIFPSDDRRNRAHWR